jgi:hypothetical protein
MEGHPGKSDGHQLHTTSEQEIMTEQRQDVPMLPCGPAKQGRQVRLFHASQQSVYYRVRMDDPREKLLEMFTNTEFTGNTCVPDVVGYGDIHRAYVMHFHHRGTAAGSQAASCCCGEAGVSSGHCLHQRALCCKQMRLNYESWCSAPRRPPD